MLYDTHSHPYFAKDLKQEDVISSFFTSGGTHLNSIWVDIESSQKCINLSKKYSWIHASVWIHPTHTLECVDTLEDAIKSLKQLYVSNSENIVAIWEIWLDYHWLESLSEKHNIPKNQIVKLQKDFFKRQLLLAKDLNMPVIIHSRDAAHDIFDMLKELNFKNFVFHCYCEDLDFAKNLLKFSPHCMLWFWWVVTFKSAQQVVNTVKHIPLKNIIVETDSPYLTPAPFRWKRENEPILAREVLSTIIDVRTEEPSDIKKQIYQNSLNFFWVDE